MITNVKSQVLVKLEASRMKEIKTREDLEYPNYDSMTVKKPNKIQLILAIHSSYFL